MNKFSKLIQFGLVGVLIAGSFLLMWRSSSQESAIMDELAHIPAGYSYVKYLDYRLNPEHPPLVKVVAAAPLLFLNLKFPTQSSAWTKDVNGQWDVGTQFLYESGNNADQIINLARIGPMLLTLILILFIYIASRELLGGWWALLPVFFFALSPSILAHGHYVTTDIGAALGIFVSTYYFIRSLFKPTLRRVIIAGLAFGIAQLMKFSAVLLIPFFLIVLLIFFIWKIRNHSREPGRLKRWRFFFREAGRQILRLVTIFVIGYAVVYAVYFVFTINYPQQKQTNDTKFILGSFSGGPDPKMETCKLNSGVDLKRRTRCLAEIDIAMTKSKILRPFGQYLLGVLMVMQRSNGGNTSYFMGEVSATGSRYYFPAVFALKEQIPLLILIAIAFLLASWNIFKAVKERRKIRNAFFNYLGMNFAEFAMLLFVIIYWIYSIMSPLNIGFRHIIPTLPFIYILTVSAIKKWANRKGGFLNFKIKMMASARDFLKTSFKGVFIGALIIWYFMNTMKTSPYFLSYFNEFAGGTDNGYRYVTDSNYDWGQDLKRLKEFVDQQGISRIAVDYFGGGNPKYYLGSKEKDWSSAQNNPKKENINWLALSINTIQIAKGKLYPGQGRNPQDEYGWLKKPYEPYSRAGTSIFIYKL